MEDLDEKVVRVLSEQLTVLHGLLKSLDAARIQGNLNAVDAYSHAILRLQGGMPISKGDE